VVAVVGGVAGGDWQRRWWFAAASGAAPSSSSLLCFSFFSQLFFSGLLPLFSTLTLFSFLSVFFSLCPPPSLSYLVFFLLLPCFYRQKQGRDMAGWPLCCLPSTTPPTRGKFLFGKWGWSASFWKGVDVFLKGEMTVTEEEKSSSSPASRVQGKKKTHSAVKTAPFRSLLFFFREQCMKRRRFGQHALFHLKGKGGKNMSEFTLVLNLWFVQSSPKLQFWFKNQCNCIPAKNQTAALKLAALFTLVLGLEFMQFDPQLSNKLLISSI